MMYYTYTSLKRQFALMMYRHAIDHNSEGAREGAPWSSIIQVAMTSVEEQGDD